MFQKCDYSSFFNAVEKVRQPNIHFLSLNESEVLKGINSFQNGSAPGIDGMRPQFLKDMISFAAGEAGKRALTSLTSLCNPRC
jgi:hypothetical protein